jgi:hypothetical protein
VLVRNALVKPQPSSLRHSLRTLITLKGTPNPACNLPSLYHSLVFFPCYKFSPDAPPYCRLYDYHHSSITLASLPLRRLRISSLCINYRQVNPAFRTCVRTTMKMNQSHARNLNITCYGYALSCEPSSFLPLPRRTFPPDREARRPLNLNLSTSDA